MDRWAGNRICPNAVEHVYVCSIVNSVHSKWIPVCKACSGVNLSSRYILLDESNFKDFILKFT